MEDNKDYAVRNSKADIKADKRLEQSLDMLDKTVKEFGTTINAALGLMGLCSFIMAIVIIVALLTCIFS